MLSVTQRNIVSLQHNPWSVLRGKSVYLYVDTLKNMSALHLDLVQQPHTRTHIVEDCCWKLTFIENDALLTCWTLKRLKLCVFGRVQRQLLMGFYYTVYSYFLNVALWSSRMSSEHAVWCKYSLCVWAWHVCSLCLAIPVKRWGIWKEEAGRFAFKTLNHLCVSVCLSLLAQI